MCNVVEDYILSAWLQHIQSYDFQHISLHFDGVRVGGDTAIDVGVLCHACEEHIHRTTGFSVTIREKKHYHFVGLLDHHLGDRCETVDIPGLLKGRGNCIPTALWHIFGEFDGMNEKLSDTQDTENQRALNRGYRSYGGVFHMFGVSATATTTVALCLLERHV